MFTNLTIIELAGVLAGPAVGMFFAELGAKVIKIEDARTGGDVSRSWKLPSESRDIDISSYFSAVNWGKRSIAIDIGAEKGQNVVYDLIARADIVIANCKPGEAEILKMDYETLASKNRRIIYGDIAAFGREDSRDGYDSMLQAAASGFSYRNGVPGKISSKIPAVLIDLLSAHQLKEAILLALIRRMVTGEGCYIHTSLLKAGIASLANQASDWLMSGHITEQNGTDHHNSTVSGNVFTTHDNKDILVNIEDDQQFRKLCEVLGRKELAAIPLYSSTQRRAKNRERLNALLAKQIRQFDQEELLQLFSEQGVRFSNIVSMEDVFEQEAARQLIVQADLASGERMAGVRTIAFDSDFLKDVPSLSPPPHLNEHGEQILTRDLGYDEDKIAGLKRHGVIY